MGALKAGDTIGELFLIELQRNRLSLGAIENPGDFPVAAQTPGRSFASYFTSIDLNLKGFQGKLPPGTSLTTNSFRQTEN